MQARSSYRATHAEGGNYGALGADLARQVFRDVDSEGDRRLWRQCAIDVLIGHPDEVAGFVVESAQDMRDIGDLAALVYHFTGERGVRRRVDFFVLDLDDGIGGGRN